MFAASMANNYEPLPALNEPLCLQHILQTKKEKVMPFCKKDGDKTGNAKRCTISLEY